MGDDIFEVKIGWSWLKLNVNALARRLRGQPTGTFNPADHVAKRFLDLFEAHGVKGTQIPRFVPAVTLAALQSTEKLLPVLTPPILEQTARLFGIQRVWLEGATDRLYDTRTCYKQPARLFEHLRELPFRQGEFQLRALTSVKELDFQSSEYQPLALVLVEKVAEVDDVDALWPIERYHVYGDSWDWSHFPARIQLKAMARVIDHLGHQPIPIYRVKRNELDAVLEGRCVPRPFVNRGLVTSPSLEDYGNSVAEHAQAKETAELPTVVEYVERYDLVWYWRGETTLGTEGE
ncbi:MAG TPA: hypothetical protein PLU52_00400 [Opitutaceae bacterium]|nr:hypothetical protein [Opitutaceae bacterium]